MRLGFGRCLKGAGLQHVVDPLLGEEGVRRLQLAQTVEEHGQVVVEIQFADLNLRGGGGGAKVGGEAVVVVGGGVGPRF